MNFQYLLNFPSDVQQILSSYKDQFYDGANFETLNKNYTGLKCSSHYEHSELILLQSYYNCNVWRQHLTNLNYCGNILVLSLKQDNPLV